MSKDDESDHGANPGAAGFALLAVIMAIATFWAGYSQGKESKGFTREEFRDISEVLFQARALSAPTDHCDIEAATELTRNLCQLKHCITEEDWNGIHELTKEINSLAAGVGPASWTTSMRTEIRHIERLLRNRTAPPEDKSTVLEAVRNLIQVLLGL